MELKKVERKAESIVIPHIRKYLITSIFITATGLLACPGPGPDDESIFLKAHRVIPAGGEISLDGMGTVLEVISVSSEDVLHLDEKAHTVTCLKGGTGFIRAHYRVDLSTAQNQIQTQCIICIDEIADCSGKTRVSFDMEMYLTSGIAGDANYLSQGNQIFYGICNTAGKYRLNRADQILPPLMYRIVDALGEGAYSLGDDAFELLRKGNIHTYSGKIISPPWLSVVSREVDILILNSDGSVTINEEDCNTVPSCTYEADFVKPGDALIIGFGIPSSLLEATINSASDALLDSFIKAHITTSWTDTGNLPAAVRHQIVYRLLGLEIMDQIIPSFDNLYDLREKAVPIGYWPYWQTRYPLSNQCLPEDQIVCQAIEDEITEHEHNRIQQWVNEGYNLYFADFLPYAHDGSYTSLSQTLPDFSLFNGLIIVIDAGRPLTTGIDKSTVLKNAVVSLASEIGEMSVYLSPASGPMTFFVTGEFCEAKICPSDFTNYYRLLEPLFDGIIDNFSPDQVKGFAIPMFDGAHFDIRNPHEDYGGMSLNRTGETGFNNPLLNIYIAQ